MSNAVVLHPADLVVEQSPDVAAFCHRCNHLLDELLGGDRLSADGPIFGVLGTGIKAGVDDSDRSGGDGISPVIEGRHCDFESISFFADSIFDRDPKVLEEDLASVSGTNSEFSFERSAGESGGVSVDDESCVRRFSVGLCESGDD